MYLIKLYKFLNIIIQYNNQMEKLIINIIFQKPNIVYLKWSLNIYKMNINLMLTLISHFCHSFIKIRKKRKEKKKLEKKYGKKKKEKNDV